MLHVSCDAPTHALPPFLGSGLVQVLIRVPPPHVLEHALKGEKPPCTGTNTNTIVSKSKFMSECRHNWMTWTKINQANERATNHLNNVAITIFTKPIRAPSKHTNINTERRNQESFDMKFCTCTGSCLACFLWCAYTSPTAISRLRIGASSDPGPATTCFRACAEGRKPAMHRN